ncbi:2-hydroxychromene-2-carboxylate isomerase [Cribrihabitans marinus]|uniref:2-hydroxychromene-2-carboxylate isomerase n=1 Tax=Cribrihabitans marinus TaxID=1227549 RepID=A0A1H7ALB3_9RHOB|nr:2-hydroxychromene-2-carboxylate isomerase [Cribrihabitans marinus]GGH31716.1 2-hydroxychromene-2-carboxylate isomerase [Cribrihabitans marinus]SEJ64677.1 2-hydroxychromene-2-carboxylate isomerase [Cribrihabitans marinus]
MAGIAYYFSTLSPYSYLAGLELEAIADRHGADIAYKPIDIVALFGRTGGTPPKDRHPSRQAYRAQDLVRRAHAVDLPFNLQPAHWPTNAAPSSYAIIAAIGAGGGDVGKLCHSILRACWAEEKDIADDAVIRDCLSGAGFEPSLADSGLLVGAETYAANLEEAVERGVFGAPFYITPDDQRFWGQDRLSDLDAHLGRGGA